MAVLYPSQEWCDAWKEAINSNERTATHGKGWGVDFNGVMLFEVTPGGGLEEKKYFYIDAKNGTCTICEMLEDPSVVDPGYVCTGPYEEFKPVVKGDRDFIDAVVMGDLNLEGDMGKIMRHSKYVKAVVDTLSEFEAEFYGE